MAAWKNQMRIHEMVGPMDGGMGWAKKLPTSDPGWPKVEMIKDTSLPLFFIATFFLPSLCVCRIKSNVKLEENITVLHAIQMLTVHFPITYNFNRSDYFSGVRSALWFFSAYVLL